MIDGHGTKSFYQNPSVIKESGMHPWDDLGYSLDIPVNDVYTAGWVDSKPGHTDGPVWGEENVMTSRNDPEFYAPWGEIRSNGLPIINVNDPRYQFSRKAHSYRVY